MGSLGKNSSKRLKIDFLFMLLVGLVHNHGMNRDLLVIIITRTNFILKFSCPVFRQVKLDHHVSHRLYILFQMLKLTVYIECYSFTIWSKFIRVRSTSVSNCLRFRSLISSFTILITLSSYLISVLSHYLKWIFSSRFCSFELMASLSRLHIS